MRPAAAQSVKPSQITNLSSKEGFVWKAAAGRLSAESAAFVPVAVPENLNAQKEAPALAGAGTATYAMRFNVPESGAVGQSLRLGEITDRDRVFLNGTLIGETGDWDSERAQAYDKVRIYEIPAGLLRPGENELIVQVRGIIKGELGIYRDSVEIGPTALILREFYLKNIIELLTLAMYVTVGAYFLLFFIRRRHDVENLFFSLFMLGLVIYSFQRTQLKYELGIPFYYMKKSQTLTLMGHLTLFYYFIRTYYELPRNGAVSAMDWFFRIYNIVPVALCIAVIVSPSADFWNFLINTLIQPSWIPHLIGILAILGWSAAKKNRDAWIMIATSMVLIVSVVLDAMTGRAIINLPTLTTYTFTLFVFSMASILANRFVRLHNETESLNAELSRFNAASRRFVPFEFLRELDKESIVEVNLGDQVAKEMTVLFSDIRSFTTLSESMTPKENFDFINSYLRRVGPVIRSNRGFIDKYIGD
ncbi:MAG: adenylate/guanylate cyclase domain-containing protein, partial [Spirochaetia bacterium]|nr:adenylate/guanylate cyclase domain-containing protein [Spirochaetia bacterium]